MENKENRTYICIDLKSFYASVECVDRGLDPLTERLVVADPERTEKTICLAITPAMKALGIQNRCRIFQIPKNVSYITAKPRMQRYIDVSAEIYAIYLKYIAKEDIHVYSIDEAFFDVTDYLNMYGMTAKELGVCMMRDVFDSTGITATCGIGTNLYLAKIALDITAKHVEDHIGILDEESYRRTLWDHKPLKDFWRVGPGIAARLEKVGIYTMRDIAQANEDLLYHIFGIDAELLIDHAWGREITTIADIKGYRPSANCLSTGQVLFADYDYEKTKLVVKEMADSLCLELVDKGLVTKSATLWLGYAGHLNLEPSKGTVNFPTETSSARIILPKLEQLCDRIFLDKRAAVHRINLAFNHVVEEVYMQYDLFVDPAEREKERRMQKAVLDIKKKFGKNAVLRGMDLQKGATAIERNKQIGGHRSGD